MKTALLCLLKLRFLGDEYLTHPVPDRFFLIENDICLFLKYFTRTWFLTSYLRYSIGFTPTLVLLDKQTTFSLTPQSVYLTKFLPVCNLNILACRYLILVCQHVDFFCFCHLQGVSQRSLKNFALTNERQILVLS